MRDGHYYGIYQLRPGEVPRGNMRSRLVLRRNHLQRSLPTLGLALPASISSCESPVTLRGHLVIPENSRKAYRFEVCQEDALLLLLISAVR